MNNIEPDEYNSVVVADGKYTVVQEGGTMYALRYNEKWRDLTGDNLVYWMFVEIQMLKKDRDEWKESTIMANQNAHRESLRRITEVSNLEATIVKLNILLKGKQ